jgi:uncharacterized repeat protein (TIGR02543 family)
MKETITNRVFNVLVMSTLIILFLACNDGLVVQEQEDKAIVSFSVMDARTVLPQVSLADVALYKLLGGLNGEEEMELAEFATTGTSISLAPGTWNFTLDAYNEDGEHILQGKVQNRQINLAGTNRVVFSLSVMGGGTGTIQITLNFPESAGITEIKTNGDTGSESFAPTDGGTFVYAKDEVAAGDYFISFELYRGDLLRAVVSELVLVRDNLTSGKTITLVGENLKPLLTGTVSISGTAIVGETLTANITNLGGSGTISYQWNRDGTAIPYANDSTYVVQETDIGWVITVTITCIGYVGGITSAPTADIPPLILISFNTLTADGSNAVLTTKLTLTFDDDITGLTVTNISLSAGSTGANGGTLTRTGTGTYELAVSGIIESGTVTVGVSKPGYAISPASQQAEVFFYAATYTITYLDVGGGAFSGTHGSDCPATHTYGTVTTLVSPTKTGYGFGGWFINSDGTGTALASLSITGYTANITLYAKWTPNTYTITYRDAGGGTFSGTHGSGYPTTHTYGTNTTLDSPTKTGYGFGGWFADSDGTGTALASLATTDYTANITLYAKWTPNTYTITYLDVGGGIFSGTHGSGYPATHTYGTATALVSPTKAGCRFSGWFINSNGVGTALTSLAATTYTANITLYAQWNDMVWIPAGTFRMGSSGNSYETQHLVTLTQGFYMGKYEVTQTQYQAVMGNNPSYFTTSSGGDNPSNRPVEQVSWYDAIIFCNKLSIAEGLSPAYSIPGYGNSTNPADWGESPTTSNATWNAVQIITGSNGYRLPTEAQWEYACRAGTTTAYNTGPTISDNTGWYSSNSDSRTHEVGSKPPNAWGLYDMHGNVTELCWDWAEYYSGVSQFDPTGASSGSERIARGGGWDRPADQLRSAFRYVGYPEGWFQSTGFRLVRP